MFVQGFAVLLNLTVVHSTDECDGATAITYSHADDELCIRVECNRVGCHPKMLMVSLDEPPAE